MSDRKEIKIGEHKFYTPELTRSSEVLFLNTKSKDAYWRREVLLQEYKDIWFNFIPHVTLLYEKMTMYDSKDVLISLNKDDSDYIMRIYEQETRRRMYGVWFKNGEIGGKENYEYITGDHYFLLMWAKMNVVGGGEYAGYREYQRDYFYLIQSVNQSKKCLGLFVSKAKKTGITNIHWIYYLNKATLYRNQNMGCMNINKDQAAKTFRDYFMLAFNGLPSPLKPQIKSTAAADGRIDFGASNRNSKANRYIAIQDPEAQLNTSVFCVPTAPKAFDVAVMNDVWMDELPKYEESAEAIVTTNKEAVKLGGYINGKMWITSYTPDKDTNSFREAKEIFDDSELRTLKDTNGSGKTKSEFWCWHIPSYASWFGEDGECFNKNGQCDQVKANHEIDNGRMAVKDNPRKLQAIKRQYAKNKKEAWMPAGEGSIFNLDRLGEILAEIEDYERNDQDAIFEEGFLEWENNLWELGLRNVRKSGQFCNVKWRPLSNEERAAGRKGKFRKYFDVPVNDRNAGLKQGKDIYGNLLPPQRHNYVIGGDPTASAAASTLIQKSKNGAGAIRVPDLAMDARFGRIVTNVFAIEYYDRPELPSEGFEDFLKLILYTGGLAYIEGNQEYVNTRMMEEGMGHFMLVYDKNKTITIWKPYMGMALSTEKEYTFIKTLDNGNGKNVILEWIVRNLVEYFHEPTNGETDYGKTCKSSRVINQMMNIDIKNTRKFDLFMCWGFALICLEVYMGILLSNQSANKNKDLFSAITGALAYSK